MEVTLNGVPTDVTDGTTIAALVATRAEGHSRIAVARNGEVVPRGAWTNTQVAPGDELEMLVAVAGG
jgi:sulfur carrier protein